MAADLPSPLLFRAIAKVPEALQRHAREARQIQECAKARPACGRARQLPAQWRVDTIAAANRGAGADPVRPPVFRQAAADNAHR